MSNIVRKLASVQKIQKFEPIPGADEIHLAQILGWQVITRKGWANPGDLVAWFEIDSFLPMRPEYEFLRSKGFKSTKNLGDGYRLKTMKMRGHISQGLILPLREVMTGAGFVEKDGVWSRDVLDEKGQLLEHQELVLTEDTDLTDYLDVQLYTKPIPSQLQGRVRGNFPIFIPKTDQERAQNYLKFIRQYVEAGETDAGFEASIKLDGSSMTVYYHRNEVDKTERVGVCSRNWDLDDDITEIELPDGTKESVQAAHRNSFWKTATDRKLTEKVKQIYQEEGLEVALQGELVGPGVQKNRERIPELEFYLYDVWDIRNQRYLQPEERQALAQRYEIKHVPVYRESVKLSEIGSSDDIMKALLDYVEDIPSLNPEVNAEGLVFKHHGKDFSFKVISNKYLLEVGE